MPKQKRSKRIPVYISADAHTELARIAERESRTLKAKVELWIEENKVVQ